MKKKYLIEYSGFLKKFIKISKPLKIVCDASNGTAGGVLEEVFKKEKNIQLILINSNPDGRFPAHGPNPLVKGAFNEIIKVIKKEKADLGAVFDADGDRIFLVDNKGKPVPSFLTFLILSQTCNPPYVADELIFQTLKFMNLKGLGKLFPSKVGSYFVKTEMKNRKASLAGEYSGHFYFKDFFYSDAAVLTLIKVCNFLSTISKDLHEFTEEIRQPKIFTDEIKLKDDSDWQKNIKKITGLKNLKTVKRDGLTLLLSKGFLNIRASNTEPILRLTCSAFKKDDCQKIILEIKKNIK